MLEQFLAAFPCLAAATLGATDSKVYLAFELLDLGLSDCVFDLELLGAEKDGEKKRAVRSSNAWLHKLSLYWIEGKFGELSSQGNLGTPDNDAAGVEME